MHSEFFITRNKIFKNTVFIYEYRQILIDINSPLKHSKTLQTILSDRHYVVDVIALDKMITVIKTAIKTITKTSTILNFKRRVQKKYYFFKKS